MPLQQDDHYILAKLNNEVLPWMIGGTRARRQWFVRLAKVYSYGGEVATALTGLGLGVPLVALFTGKVANGKDGLALLREALPGPWFWVGVAALVLWIVVRILVAREDAVARALFARECDGTMQKLYTQLHVALSEPTPMTKIGEIQKSVILGVEKAIDNKVWPWNPPMPPPHDIQSELDAQIDEIRRKYMALWAPPPPVGGRQ